VLYGRLPGYHLSELGRLMAERVASTLKGHDVTHLVSSPLERAQETAQPAAGTFGLEIVTDPRVIEATNVFEGQRFGVGDGSLRKPSVWKHLYDPFKPSWGEPYKDVVVRMLAAMHDAREAATGHEALIVSHQLPVWIVRTFIEGRRLVHNPRKRQCSLASLTSFTYHGDRVVTVAYSEPAADLVPVRATKKFTAGA
jgi:broad specificity phosphatase PhoE